MASGVLAVIPARGGSTRIPGKNIRLFNGRPMIEWSLAACHEIAGVDEIVVSTEDPEISRIARSAGATRVIDRPADLASNTAGTAPVVRHALDELSVGDDALVMCLYATAHLPSSMIEEVIGLALRNPENFVVTVGRHRSPIERSLLLEKDGLMSMMSREYLLSRTQDLPTRFFDAGKVYLAKASLWRERDTMMDAPFVPFFLPDWAAVDLDEPEDWAVAEALHREFVLGRS